ncbi:hypothetical protein NECAME_09972 [Necator americanus]|uniref:Uncharacterized protein n=1 Tax=Necator americanus TaxID=51031 RepID=W2TD99_NECAM|nr:hypothetical protein NECAME_09972 [Necator americanus]ETN79166.1 hypothetical protein NECAME_09972 [Necator americanus]
MNLVMTIVCPRSLALVITLVANIVIKKNKANKFCHKGSLKMQEHNEDAKIFEETSRRYFSM